MDKSELFQKKLKTKKRRQRFSNFSLRSHFLFSHLFSWLGDHDQILWLPFRFILEPGIFAPKYLWRNAYSWTKRHTYRRFIPALMWNSKNQQPSKCSSVGWLPQLWHVCITYYHPAVYVIKEICIAQHGELSETFSDMKWQVWLISVK